MKISEQQHSEWLNELKEKYKELNLVPKDKDKEVKYKSYLLGKKRKTQGKSDNAKLIDLLIKNKITEEDDIESYLRTNGVKVSLRSNTLLSSIVKSSVKLSSVRLSDNISNKPLYYYYYPKFVFKTNIITNDGLYLNSLFNSFMADKEKKVESNFYVTECTFITGSFNCTGKIEKGYYQDFNKNCAFIGLEYILNDKDKNNDKNKDVKFDDLITGNDNNFEFYIKNLSDKPYTTYYYNDSYIIYNDEIKNDIANYYNSMKIIKTDKEIELGVKTISTENNTKYIQNKVNSEYFCPAFLHLPIKENFSVQFKVEIDDNIYFKMCEEKFKNANVNEEFEVFNWETLPQFFDFLGVFAITANIDKVNKEKFANIYKDYIKNKSMILSWRKVILDGFKLIYSFYNSFTNKLHYDKLITLNKRAKVWHDNYNIMVNEGTYNEIKDIVFKWSKELNESIKDWFDLGFTKLLEDIVNVLNNLSLNKTDNFVRRSQEIAIRIADDSMNNLYPFIVSPGAFLGNVTKDDLYSRRFTGIVGKISKSLKESKLFEETSLTKAAKLFSIYPKYLDKIIRNTLNKSGVKNIDLLTKNILEKLNDKKNKEINDKIYKEIYKNYDPNKNVSDFKATSKNLNKWIGQFKDNQKIEDINNDIKINQLKRDIIDKENEISKLEDEKEEKPDEFEYEEEEEKEDDEEDEKEEDVKEGEVRIKLPKGAERTLFTEYIFSRLPDGKKDKNYKEIEKYVKEIIGSSPLASDLGDKYDTIMDLDLIKFMNTFKDVTVDQFKSLLNYGNYPHIDDIVEGKAKLNKLNDKERKAINEINLNNENEMRKLAEAYNKKMDLMRKNKRRLNIRFIANKGSKKRSVSVYKKQPRSLIKKDDDNLSKSTQSNLTQIGTKSLRGREVPIFSEIYSENRESEKMEIE